MNPMLFLSGLGRGRVKLCIQVLRFLMAGAINTLFGYAVYLVGLYFGLLPEASLFVATAIGATFNYFTTSRLVFKHSKVDRFPPFVLAYVAIYLTNAGLLRGLIHTGMRPELAQLMVIPLVATLSFAIFRQFVFPKESRDVPKND